MMLYAVICFSLSWPRLALGPGSFLRRHLAGKPGISIIYIKIKIFFGILSDNVLGPKNISLLSLNYVNQNLLFTPLRETTSIPVSVIWTSRSPGAWHLGVISGPIVQIFIYQAPICKRCMKLVSFRSSKVVTKYNKIRLRMQWSCYLCVLHPWCIEIPKGAKQFMKCVP